jgi:hypothetical protein
MRIANTGQRRTGIVPIQWVRAKGQAETLTNRHV